MATTDQMVNELRGIARNSGERMSLYVTTERAYVIKPEDEPTAPGARLVASINGMGRLIAIGRDYRLFEQDWT